MRRLAAAPPLLASLAADGDGDRVWFGAPPPDGEPCVRVGDLSRAEVVPGIEEMERARGETRVSRLRETPAAPVTGCGAGTR